MDVISLDLSGRRVGAAVHHLPCSIRHDGAAKVSTFFVPEPAPAAGGGAADAAADASAPTLVAYFRGRRLDGTVVALPRGVTGAVLREVAADAAATDPAGAASMRTPAPRGSGGGGGGVSAAVLAALAAEDEDDDDDGGGGGGLFDADFGDFGAEDDDGDGSGGGGALAGKKRSAAEAGLAGSASAAAAPAAAAAGKGGGGGGGGGGGVQRAMVVDATFASLTCWQHERPSTDADLVPVALEWLELARALHEP